MNILKKIVSKTKEFLLSFWLKEQAQAQLQHQKQKQGDFDYPLLFITFSLMTIGLIMVYSSSIDESKRKHLYTDYFFNNQLTFAIFGIVMMMVFSFIPYLMWKRLAKIGLFLGLLGLLLVLLIGKKVNGATRWIPLGPIHIQPAEMFKILWINYLAYYFSNVRVNLSGFKDLWHIVMLISCWVCLLYLQPDIGSMIFSMIFSAILIFLAGFPLLGSGVFVIVVMFLVIAVAPFQSHVAKRLLKFFSQDEIHYNIKQGLISFSKGGEFGIGLGESQQKFKFLPESHTDFIFNIIGEELGLMGASFILCLFLAFLYRGIKIAVRASTNFGSLLASTITIFICFQGFFNIGMALALLPTKGLTLPFISYGGTSLVTFCCCVGILLNISKIGRMSQREVKMLIKPWGFFVHQLKEHQELTHCKQAMPSVKKNRTKKNKTIQKTAQKPIQAKSN
jgi:cell division protein FtsW